MAAAQDPTELCIHASIMARAWNRVRGVRPHEYAPLPLSEKEPLKTRDRRRSRFTVPGLVLCIAGGLFALYGLLG